MFLEGNWSMEKKNPSFSDGIRDELSGAHPREIIVNAEPLEGWDSILLVFLVHLRNYCRENGLTLSLVGLPSSLKRMLDQIPEGMGVNGEDSPKAKRRPFFQAVGEGTQRQVEGVLNIFEFLGEVVIEGGRAIRRPARFRWGDALWAMQQCGAMGLPIVGLISFLVGMILAFQAAVQLQQFGADIFVADLVGLAVVREMGAMMAAIILAGRTGAAFAAQLGAMKVNEEIDALETMGISSVRFLVLPRILALFLMMPLLTLYANLLGIIGGFFVGVSILDIPISAYWIQTREAIGLGDMATGLIKSVFFGLIIAVAGCLRGFQCPRSSEGVGGAATSAVVTSILFIIIFDALFAVIFNRIGL